MIPHSLQGVNQKREYQGCFFQAPSEKIFRIFIIYYIVLIRPSVILLRSPDVDRSHPERTGSMHDKPVADIYGGMIDALVSAVAPSAEENDISRLQVLSLDCLVMLYAVFVLSSGSVRDRLVGALLVAPSYEPAAVRKVQFASSRLAVRVASSRETPFHDLFALFRPCGSASYFEVVLVEKSLAPAVRSPDLDGLFALRQIVELDRVVELGQIV